MVLNHLLKMVISGALASDFTYIYLIHLRHKKIIR